MPKLRLSSSLEAASVVSALKELIEESDWNNLRSLIDTILNTARSFSKDFNENPCLLNVCLRVIKIAREEALKVKFGCNADFEENSTNRLFASGDTSYELASRDDILDPILSALDELKVDIRSCLENISDLSLGLVHSDELILTGGFSLQVYHFLKRVADKKRVFKVIVSEGYPENSGHKLALDLTKNGIDVILVPDSHVFGLMSRVNKVIIGCDAVYADGTIRAPVGTHSILTASEYFSVPTYVCLPQYQLSPLFPITSSSAAQHQFTVLPTSSPSQHAVDWLGSPGSILPAHDCLAADGTGVNAVTQGRGLAPVVWVPRWEYIPAGHVSLFLTNLGSHAPSYLYALIRELFHPSDIETVVGWF